MISEKRKTYEEKFNSAMAMLNDAQREAVEQIDGPVVVFAGPGTGKTQMLALRIANIIYKNGADFAPNILALTFTNAGVTAMRKRLAEFIGPELAHGVGIFTFHSLAQFYIENHREFFPEFEASRLVNDVEQYQILEDLLRKGKYKKIVNFYHSFEYFIPNLLKAIYELKDEGISPDEFRESLKDVRERVLERHGDDAFLKRKSGDREKGDLKKAVEMEIQNQEEKQRELADLYEKYQEELREKKLYDFSDMILSFVEKVEKDAEFKTILQEQYFYLLVDEHQDTNKAQNAIIHGIADAPVNEGKPNIFTVGDDKQAIYRFQGASRENFLAISKRYREVKQIHLDHNYRSSQNILDLAHGILPGEKKLIAKHPQYADEERKVHIYELQDRDNELIFLAKDIEKKIKDGEKPSEIAVFGRKNRELSEIARIFDKFHIPYNLFVRENILRSKEIRSLLSLFQVIHNPYNDEYLSQSFFSEIFPLRMKDILRLLEEHRFKKGKKYRYKHLFDAISDKNYLEYLRLEDTDAISHYASFIEKMRKRAEENDFLAFLEDFLEESSFFSYIFSQDDQQMALKRFDRFFQEIKKQSKEKESYSFKDFMNFIQTLDRYNIQLDLGGSGKEDGVSIMTAHGSKGLEFESVYITNAVMKYWGKVKHTSHGFVLPVMRQRGDIDDERRLFYVALTRAKKDLRISYGKYADDGKEQIPSLFVEELKEIGAQFDILSPEERKDILPITLSQVKKESSLFDMDFIRHAFLSRDLSVSALNNYFKSPIVYFFRNLVLLPSVQTRPLIFGNIIHRTLQMFFQEGKKGNLQKEDLLSLFDTAIAEFYVPREDFDDLYERGRELLSDYYEHYKNEFDFSRSQTEKDFVTSFQLEGGEEIRLKGFIDRIDMLPGNKIRVVDYKTGKTYPEKSKKDKEALDRQLVFYKMLIDRFYDDNRVSEGVLDFMEKNKKTGEYVRRVKEFTSDEVLNLEKEMGEFAKDILSGAFLEREYQETPDNREYFKLWEELRRRKF